MFTPGDPAPALSKSTIVAGSGTDESFSNRPASTYEVSVYLYNVSKNLALFARESLLSKPFDVTRLVRSTLNNTPQ